MHTTTRSKSGFTIIELLVAMTLFVMLAIAAIQIFFFVLHQQRNINTQKKLQDETRFLIERMVKEYRNGTIDFAEYYMLNDVSNSSYEDYVALPPDGSVTPYVGTDGDSSDQELYIIYPSGDERTIFFLGEKGATCGAADLQDCICHSDTTPCDLMLRKEKYFDDNEDGVGEWKEVEWAWKTDHFELSPVETPGDGTEILNSSRIRINDLSFRITPAKDPFKFYDDNDVQFQPMVTIFLTTAYMEESLNLDPVEIQTSVSSRLYHEIEWNIAATN